MRKLLLCLLCVIISGINVPVYALETAVTPENEFMPSAPILVTGYQLSEAAQRLTAVEIFNASDAPIDLGQWLLYVGLKDGVSVHVPTSSAYAGYFLPGDHVTYSGGTKTTFSFILEKQPVAISTIEFRYAVSGAYKPATAVVKDQNDLPYFRTYTSTGYSTSTSLTTPPFSAMPPRVFYDDGLYKAPADIPGLRIVEIYPYSSDCAPNDMGVLCGDYIKLVNAGVDEVTLDDLVLRTDSSSASRTSSNTFALLGILKPGDYVTIANTDSGTRLSLTNSGGYVWIEDTWGLQRYDNTMTKYESAGTNEQGYAYALTTDNLWVWTTTPQPSGANMIAAPVVVVAECPDGKYRSPDTGRCRTIEEAVNALSICEEGYERNPVTNRCRKMTVATTAAVTPCLEGQERNPTTNRCRSIASAVAELLPCEEGYERNPDTNRCRKASASSMPEAAFPVTPVAKLASDMAGWWAFGVVLAMAIGYGIWEWRVEIVGFARRALGIFTRTK